MKHLYSFTACLLCIFSQAQKPDTVLITAKNLVVSQLKPGNHDYLVYFKKDKNAPASDLQIWHLRVTELNHNGEPALSVSQQWDYKDTILHTATSICRKSDFKPLYHESWWKNKGSSSYNPLSKELFINGAAVKDGDPSKKNAAALSSFQSSFDQYYLNWHLDLETFAMLPYRKNTTFLIPFYEFGYSKPDNIAYTVSGEAELKMGNVVIPCWLLKHEEPGNSEVFWISKSTKEVLKMEQLINDKMYRYKVKLMD